MPNQDQSVSLILAPTVLGTSKRDSPSLSQYTSMGDEKFRNAEGRTLNRMQIFRFGWKEGAKIEPIEEGYVVNGELYRRVRKL